MVQTVRVNPCHLAVCPFSVVPENINAPSFPACFAIWVWVSGSVVLRPSMAERPVDTDADVIIGNNFQHIF